MIVQDKSLFKILLLTKVNNFLRTWVMSSVKGKNIFELLLGFCCVMSEYRLDCVSAQANMGDTVAGVYYRPPDQEEEVDKAFNTQLKVASQSQALVLTGDFNHPDICWKDNTARCTLSRRFLQNTGDDNQQVERGDSAPLLCSGETSLEY